MDSIVFREDVLIESKKLSVGDDFDVNNTVVIAASTGNVSGMGTLGCGAITSTGAVAGTSVADGTVSLAGDGTITGVTSMAASGAISGSSVSDGTVSLAGDGSITGVTSMAASGAISGSSVGDGTVSLAGDGTITGVTSMNASGTLTTDTLTDGTLSINMGSITGLSALTATGDVEGSSVTDGTVSLAGDGTVTGVTSMNVSGTLTGGTLTDGTFSVNAGAVTGATSIACSSINCSGSIQGDVDLNQLKANSSVTLNKDGSTWTELSTITGSSGAYILQVRAHTDNNAASIFMCSSDGTTGSCSRLSSVAGSTSSVKVQARWQATTSIEIKYESSWGGGTGTVGAYAVSMFPAA